MKRCECGCGEPAPIATQSSTARGYVKGEPKRFIRGHATRGRAVLTGPVVEVDPETGCWVWQRTMSGFGYGLIKIDGEQWRAHRLFFICEYGYLPEVIDHICRNKACVNPAHLREATVTENNQNIVARRAGRLGVSQRGERWHAQVKCNGQGFYLGMFDTEDEAGDVVAAFRAEHMPYSPEARKRAA